MLYYNDQRMASWQPQGHYISRKKVGGSTNNGLQEDISSQRQPLPLLLPAPSPIGEPDDSSDDFILLSLPPQPDTQCLANVSSQHLLRVSSVASTRSPASKDLRFKPCVVPQTSKTLPGHCYRPFTRVYSPGLAQYSISEEDFLLFIDGLNEAWLAHWTMQNMAGFPPFIEARLTSLGVIATSEAGAAIHSKKRTAAYLRAANDRFFRPRGLHAQVLLTPQMMAIIGALTSDLKIPPVDEHLDSNGGASYGASRIQANDPRIRRLAALKDFTMPITFNSTFHVPSNSNSLAGASEAQEDRFVERENKILSDRCAKGQTFINQANLEATRINERVSALDAQVSQMQLVSEQKKYEVQMKVRQKKQGIFSSRNPEKRVEKKMAKIDKELSKDVGKINKGKEKLNKWMRKGEKKGAAVEKKAHRLIQEAMWIVISKDDNNVLWKDDIGGFDWVPDPGPTLHTDKGGWGLEAQMYKQHLQRDVKERVYQKQVFTNTTSACLPETIHSG